MRTLLNRFRACRSGSTAVEFAFTSLAFVLLSVGTVECGRAFFVRNEMGHAVDVAARKSLVNLQATDDDIENALRAAFTQGDPNLLEIDIDEEEENGMSRRHVVMRYPLTLIPGLNAMNVMLRLERRIPLADQRWWLER